MTFLLIDLPQTGWGWLSVDLLGHPKAAERLLANCWAANVEWIVK